MSTFQLVTLPIVAAMVVATGVAAARRKVAPRVGAAWIALWLAAAVAIAIPGLLSKLADFLGIGRGADVVMYASILCMFIAFFLVYLRFRRLDEQITAIVRHLAIRERAGEPARDDASPDAERS